ncbi:MAG: ATP-binding protein [Desulfobacterales bacterium]|nr:ATP-binding protein [Desulfobacterales bacterium]
MGRPFTMPSLPNNIRTKKKLPGRLLFMLILLTAVLVYSTYLIARSSTLSDLDGTARERLGLYRSTLESALDKYRYLPYLLSENDAVICLLSGRADPGAVNVILETANEKAGSAALFIMDETGKTLCASNWKDPSSSFVGRNYGFRPYFRDAMAGNEGGFYAIGATTGTPGYFMSHPVHASPGDRTGRPIGVVVVKVDLSGLERHWMEGGEIVFVSDASGIIFLSGHTAWKYKSIEPLTPETLKTIRQGRQYKGIRLDTLALEKGGSDAYQWIRINNEKFFWAGLTLEKFHWQLNYLIPWNHLKERVNIYLYISSALGVLFILCLLFVQERRLKKISQQKALAAERMGRMNERLQREVDERRRTEGHLRHTQEELVQSAKLAALGQMAAAVVHELNQPIAAIRTYAASCRLMNGQNKKEDLNKTLYSISEITDRMEAITRQLKDFSRKTPLKVSSIDARVPVQKACELLRHTLSDAECCLVLDMPPGPVTVLGDRFRLEQVFVNLIKNSLDAMVDTEDKRITLTFLEDNDTVEIRIKDTGPGIRPGLKEKIFTPFFTTKPDGTGMGLGLSISSRIVKEMSGGITLESEPEPGAVFSVRLKKG